MRRRPLAAYRVLDEQDLLGNQASRMSTDYAGGGGVEETKTSASGGGVRPESAPVVGSAAAHRVVVTLGTLVLVAVLGLAALSASRTPTQRARRRPPHGVGVGDRDTGGYHTLAAVAATRHQREGFDVEAIVLPQALSRRRRRVTSVHRLVTYERWSGTAAASSGPSPSAEFGFER